MIAREFVVSPASFFHGGIDGSSFVEYVSRMICTLVAGSERKHIAQSSWSKSVTSISSSTTTTYFPANAPTPHCAAMKPACVACPGYFCLIETPVNMREPPTSWHQTDCTSGTPERLIESLSCAERTIAR